MVENVEEVVPNESVRITLGTQTELLMLELSFLEGEAVFSAVHDEASVLGEKKERFVDLMKAAGKSTLFGLFSIASQFLSKEKVFNVEPEPETPEHEQGGWDLFTEDEPPEEDDDLKDSRMGYKLKLAEYDKSLSRMCSRVLGDNLLLFDEESFSEMAPIEVKAKIFVYLSKSRSLSSKKFMYLLGKEMVRLDLGRVSDFVRDVYVERISSTCMNLQKLCLKDCKLTGPDFVPLSKLHHLVDIDVSHTEFDDEALSVLAPSICFANFSHTKIKSSILTFVNRCGPLKVLNISHCKHIHWNACMSMLGALWPSFERLNAAFSGADIDDDTFFFPVLGEKRIHGYHFNLDECAWLSDVALDECVFPHLQSVSFGARCDARMVLKFLCTRAPRIVEMKASFFEPLTSMCKFRADSILAHRVTTLNFKNVSLNSTVLCQLLALETVHTVLLDRIGQSVGHVMRELSQPRCDRIHTVTLGNLTSKELSIALRDKTFRYLKLYDIEMCDTFFSTLCKYIHTKTLILRGKIQATSLDPLAFFSAPLEEIVVEKDQIVAPMDFLISKFGVLINVKTVRLFGYTLDAVFSPAALASYKEHQTIVSMSKVEILEISLSKFEEESLVLDKRKTALEMLSLMFPNLSTITLKHQFRTLSTVVFPRAKAVYVCKNDQLKIKDAKIYKPKECVLCNKYWKYF
jgi:hypothetical protein